MTDKYVLNDAGEAVPEPDLMKWGQFMQTGERKVALDAIGFCKVSTVFLGLDHAFHDGPPVLWETMVFGGKLDREMDRCSGTKEDAIGMHQRMVQKVKEAV